MIESTQGLNILKLFRPMIQDDIDLSDS